MKSKRAGNKKRKQEEMVHHVESRKRLKENEKAQNLQELVESNTEASDEVEPEQVREENVFQEAQPPHVMEEERVQHQVMDSEADLEDKIVPQDSEVQAEEQSEFSDLEDIYKPREPLEIQEGDLELASNFLNSLGEDLMEDDVLDFL